MRLQITPKFSSVLLAISYLTSVLAKTVYVPSQGKFCAGNYIWCPPKVYMDTEQKYQLNILGQEKVLIAPNSTTFRTRIRAGDGIFLNQGDTRVLSSSKLYLDAPTEIELQIGGITMMEVYDNRTPVKNNLQVRAGMKLAGGWKFMKEPGINTTAVTPPPANLLGCTTWGEISIVDNMLHVCKPASGATVPPFTYYPVA